MIALLPIIMLWFTIFVSGPVTRLEAAFKHGDGLSNGRRALFAFVALFLRLGQLICLPMVVPCFLALWFVHRQGISMSTFFFKDMAPLRHGLMGIALGAGFATINSALAYRWGFNPDAKNLLYSVVYAPITEEIVYRGYLKVFLDANGLGSGGITAASISALLFAFAHVIPSRAYLTRLDAQIFMMRVLFGLSAYFLYIETGSMMATIFAHIAANAVHESAIRTVFKRRLVQLQLQIDVLQAKIQQHKRRF